MEWTERQILETLRLIEASDYDEVKLESGDFKLHVRKSGAPPVAAELPASSAASPRSSASPAPVAAVESTAPPAAGESAPPQVDAALPPGVVAIRAPMVGTFYRAPSPHAPPFVDTGASVSAEDTVCLIEVMKLFSTIKAGVSGKVARIVAHNAATVGKDEVLMWIEPDNR
jgi:acetyl-CoA carboxylase biotin carboxyl carrier protein